MGATGSKETRRWPLETMCDHDGGINCMAVSDDQSLLVTGSEDKTARVWAIGTEKTECIGIIRGHTSYVTCLTLNDTYVFTGSADNTIRKWDAISCNCLFTYYGHESRVVRLVCTGEYILSASMDDTAKAWLIDEDDLEMISSDDGSACVQTFKGHAEGVCSLIVVPGEEDEGGLQVGRGDLIITGSFDNTARSWDFQSGKCLRKFEGHTNCVTCLAPDPTTKLLYTGSSDKTVRCWDLETAVCYAILANHQGHVVCVVALGKLLYSGDGNGDVKVWEMKPRDYYATHFQVQRKAFIRPQPLLEDPLYAITQHRNTVNQIILHHGILYTACSDNLTRAFDVQSREMVAVFTGHKIAVTCMAICGSKLYTASTDTTLMVWDLARRSGEERPESSSNSSSSSNSDTGSSGSSDEEGDS